MQIDENQTAHQQHGRIGLARTGLSDLDHRLGGFRAGQLVIIGGRTGQGKTSLATSMALYMAYVESVPVAMFSLEMTDIDIGIRMVCAEANVSTFRAMNGQLNADELARFGESQVNLHAMPFYIDKTANLTLAAFIARCHELCADHGVKVIILDYLQLMRGPKEAQNREQEVAAISRACKQIALSQKIVVIALSQLSREADKRMGDGNKLPVLTDLRESGALEQDADVVLFPWRKMNLDGDGREIRQAAPIEAKIKIAKLRNGQCGIVPCWFNPEPMTFIGMAKEPGGGYADRR